MRDGTHAVSFVQPATRCDGRGLVMILNLSIIITRAGFGDDGVRLAAMHAYNALHGTDAVAAAT